MQLIRPSSRAELIAVWLRSEWARVPAPRPSDRGLVDDPDLADQAANEERVELLNRDRRKILAEVPTAVEYELVDIELDDLPKTYALVCVEWYMDTGGTFRLSDTPANLKAAEASAGPRGSNLLIT
jgi:hypothetical protein